MINVVEIQKMTKKADTKKVTIKQGKSEVGYKNLPKEAQFKPGQSGNPAGPPKRRTQLWTYFCRYMALDGCGACEVETR
jgi:hypothetical protein